MTAIYIVKSKTGKETTNEGEHIICNVTTSNPTNEERRAVVTCILGIFEREISHIIETCQESPNGYTEL